MPLPAGIPNNRPMIKTCVTELPVEFWSSLRRMTPRIAERAKDIEEKVQKTNRKKNRCEIRKTFNDKSESNHLSTQEQKTVQTACQLADTHEKGRKVTVRPITSIHSEADCSRGRQQAVGRGGRTYSIARHPPATSPSEFPCPMILIHPAKGERGFVEYHLDKSASTAPIFPNKNL